MEKPFPGTETVKEKPYTQAMIAGSGKNAGRTFFLKISELVSLMRYGIGFAYSCRMMTIH